MQILKALENLPENLDFVVLDDNFYYPSMRQPFVLFAREQQMPILEVYFLADLNTCLRRNEQRNYISQGNPVSAATIQNMAEKLKIPEASQNLKPKTSQLFLHENKNNSSLNNNLFENLDSVLKFLEDKNNLPSPPSVVKSIEKYEVLENERIEKNLRLAVSEIFKNSPEVKSRGKEIAEIKKSILRRQIASSEDSIIDLKNLILSQLF